MMPSRSTPNLQQQATRDTKNNHAPSIYSYLHNQSGLNFAPVSTSPTRNEESPPPAPPVRDSSSLKSVKYGPGHEKFPSWPVPAAAEAPQALRVPPSGGSHRSKSWTDHTNYPKEKVVTYTRPYMKRQNSSHIQQKLKTVMEKCEKIPPETYESHFDKINDRLYLPHVDRDGKAVGDMEYNVPSPPERDINKPQLTQEELEEYARSYQESSIEKYGHYNPDMKGLENFIEYARSYEEYHINQKHDATVLTHLHQKQLSYAQSEGYHSYVSSTDSTSTPFLDRLRRDSEAIPARQSDSWDDITEPEPVNIRREGRDSVVTTSSGSASSSETLKWHGSMSDVSVASSSHLANSSISSVQRQLIAHSARVQTPQRHHSESVLYMGGENQENWKDRENRNNNTNKLKLFAVNTYTVQSDEHKSLQQGLTQPQQVSNRTTQPSLSVADRINELEKQQKYSYLDPDKKHKVPDPTLKAIQKKALLSFYERHHNSSSSNPNTTNKTNTWRSEPQLAQSQSTLVQAPQPPPRIKAQTPTRRASCASDYASNNNSKRSSFASSRENRESGKMTPRHQHSNSCGSLSTDLLGPVIVGPSISLDDWVPQKPPERPPKNPHLRIAYPDLFQDQRVPSPDLPPPSPPTVLEDEVINSDEPLPPPPTELENSDWQTVFDDRLKENRTRHQFAAAQVETGHKTVKDTVIHTELCLELPRKSTVGILERGGPRYSSVRHVPNEHKLIFSESRHYPSDNKDGINDKSGHSDNRHVVGESRLIDDKHRHSTDGLLQNESRHSQNDNSKKHASDIRLSNDNRSFGVENTHPYKSPVKEQPVFGFPNQRNYAERSSARYPPMHKLILNGNIAVSQKIINGLCDQYRAEPLRSVSLKDDEKLLAVSSIRNNQRASIAEGSPRDIPPPLQPRQMRINQSMRARIPEGRPGGITTRNSPLRDEKVRDTKQPNYSMSPSKASYLASRRDRNRIAPDPDTGSYKRTLSPNGHILSVDVTAQDPPKLNPKDTIWTIKADKQTIINNNNTKNCALKNQDMKEDLKNQIILPDVLPINAKLTPRSQYPNRPTNLTLPVHMDHFTPTQSPLKSPPSSPPKSPSRNSPYTPLRSTNLSSSPMRTPSMRVSPQTTTSNSPQFLNSPTTVSSSIRTFPSQKVLSPTSPSQKTTGLEFRPMTLSLQRSLSADSKPVPLPLHRNTPPSLRTSPISFSAKQSPIQSPEQQSPPPLPKSSPPIKSSFTFTSPQSPDIKPTLSPSLSNKTTPIKVQSPPSTSANTPLRTTPESSPSSSPEILSLTHMISPPQSPKEPEYPKVIEGLQMIQRTEVILRVNATTIDAASQTDKEELPPTPLPTRRKLQEEIECEKLSEDFVKQLPATDRLKGLLVPGPEHKKLTDYVSGLFRVDVTMKPRPTNSPFRSRNNTPSSSPPPVNSINATTYITTKSSSDTTSVVPSIEPTSPLSATSPYFTTSEPKAKFLTRYSQDMNQYTIKNTKDLNQKKDELVNRLDRKLEVLRSEQLVVSEECRINNELGENVESHLAHVARPHETSKFRLHIEEVGKITSLLLSLSGRLARVENALMGMAEDHPERRILESKRDKLLDQLDEAKKLKESIDRRSVNVSNILYKYLTSEEYADYDHFINMKAKLIMDSKEISDKIKLGEEQLMALKETLIVTD